MKSYNRSNITEEPIISTIAPIIDADAEQKRALTHTVITGIQAGYLAGHRFKLRDQK